MPVKVTFKGVDLIGQANFKYYHQKNEMLLNLPADPNRIVMFGDSITQDWNSLRPDFFGQHSLVCRGIGGQTTPQMLLRFRKDVVDLSPKKVIILAGTNDVAGITGDADNQYIRDNIATMADIALANRIEPIICSVLPVLDYPWKPNQHPVTRIPQLNELLEQICDSKNLLFVDYFSAFVDQAGGMKAHLTTDGVHVNVAGYEMMESILQRFL